MEYTKGIFKKMKKKIYQKNMMKRNLIQKKFLWK